MRITRKHLSKLISEELSTLNEEEYDRRRDMGRIRRGTASRGGRQAYFQNRASQERAVQAAIAKGKLEGAAAANATNPKDRPLGKHGAYYTAYDAAYDAALNAKPERPHPLDVDGNGELTITVSESQLREMIEQISEQAGDIVPIHAQYAEIIGRVTPEVFGLAMEYALNKLIITMEGKPGGGNPRTYHDVLLWDIRDFIGNRPKGEINQL